jgi:sugar porter (SP) family MFS transporter
MWAALIRPAIWRSHWISPKKLKNHCSEPDMTKTTPAPQFNLSYLIPICLVATLGGLLFGYDTGVISGAIEPLTAKFALSGSMKGWVSGCVLIGCAFGVLIVGPVSDRFGRKKALFLSAILFLISTIGTAVAPSIAFFVIFRFLGGFGIGVASISTPMYIAEITPAHVRGRLVAVNQIAIVTGLTVVYFANYAIAQCGDQAWNINMSWRWMFASGLLPAALFALLLIKIPESPRWLMEQKREDEARTILDRVAGIAFAQSEMDSIRNALNQEKGTWKELFSSKLYLPLVIGILLAILQQVTGINVFMYFGTTLFKNISQSTGVDAGMIQQSLIGVAGIFFTVIAITLVDKWGRKPLMFIGTVGMCISLVAMGGMAQMMKNPAAAGTPMLLCIIIYLGCFSLSAGPVIWVILSEIYPTAVRGRALGLAVFCMWMADYAVTQTFPMMDKNTWLVERFNHAFPFYVYAMFCLFLIVVMCYVPETKGKSLEEIEQSWGRRSKLE